MRPPSIDRSGAVFATIGEMVKREADQLEDVAAEDALNKLREKRIELTMGPDKGFQRLQGGAVVSRPVLDEFPAEFGKEIESIEGTLFSPRAKAKFRQRANSEASGYKADLLRHVASQTEKYRTDVFNSTLKVESGYAASQFTDPTAVSAAIGRVAEKSAAEAERQGITDPKALELFLQETSGAVAYAAIRGALDADQSAVAQQIFDTYKDKLSDTQKHAVMPGIQSATAWDAGQILATNAFAKKQAGEPPTDIERYLIAETKGNKQMYANAQSVLGQLERAKKEELMNNADAAQNEINKGAPWQKIRGRYLNQMDPSVVAAFDQRAKALAESGRDGGAPRIKTDRATYYELTVLAGDDDREKFRKRLLESSGKLSDSDFQHFTDKLAKAKKDPEELKDMKTYAQQLSDAHDRVQINGRKDADKRGAFDAYVDSQLRAKQKELGRIPNQDERELVIRKAETKGEISWGRDRRYYEVVGTEKATEFKPEIPDAERKAIADKFRRDSIEPTEKRIVDYYRRSKGLQ